METVVFGGTFDRLHRGHKEAIKLAGSLGKKVVFGVTSREFFGGKRQAEIIQPYQIRVENLKNFLKSEGMLSRSEVKEISRMEGDADTNEAYDAIIVTSSTKENGQKINEARRRQGLRELVLVELPLVLAEDGKPISSTRIRLGQIDTEGKPLQQREVRSKVRQNIAQILEEGPAYGYEIHKKYKAGYGKISLRLVYYHLSKGVREGIFEVRERKAESGGYSWGRQVERIYYSLST